MTVVGLQWVQSTDTYSCPAADSIGSLTPATRVAACNSIDPWMSMVRCNLWDNGVQTATGANSNTSTAADRCYTDTDVANMGQVMVKIKKFWYAMVYSAGTYRWYISSTGADSLPSGVSAWKVHPAFNRNSVTKAQIYVGAYEGYYDGVSKLESLAGVTPTISQPLATFRTQAEARGTGWEQNDYLLLSALGLLTLLEYGTFRVSFAGLGYGIISGSLHNTGETTTHGNTSYGSMVNGTTALSYRGVENLWGNTLKLIDGININNYVPAIADHGFANDTYTGTYTSTGLTIGGPIAAGFASNIITSSTYDYVFFPSAGGATYATDICASLYSATGPTGMLSGDSYATAFQTALFSWDSNNAEAINAAMIGSRLMYIG